MTTYHWKKVIVILLCICLWYPPLPCFAKMETKREERKVCLDSITFLLKEVLDSQYKREEALLKQKIVEKQYDYSLTMDSFYLQPDPFEEIDMISMLAAYMSAKEYGEKNSIYVPPLYEIPLFTSTEEEKSETIFLPKEVVRYEKVSEEGKEYYPNGTYYVFSPTEIEVYAQKENGRFEKTGKKEVIKPETKEVSYLEFILKPIEPKDLFSCVGIEEELLEKSYEDICRKLRQITSKESMRQSIFFTLPKDSDFSSLFTEGLIQTLEEEEMERKQLILMGLSLYHKVPYEFGGKARFPGYDNSWFSFVDNKQKGLDCSGFVEWALMSAGFSDSIYRNYHSTGSLLETTGEEIRKEMLRPGDVGCTDRRDGRINHMGIYLGDNLWIHCSSSEKTVTISTVEFTRFFSPFMTRPVLEDKTIQASFDSLQKSEIYINSYNIKKYIDTRKEVAYTEGQNQDEVLLLARLMVHEAKGEGINGWIGVGEVVKNRVSSALFPNTVSDVIYDPGQFSFVERLEYITPSEEFITVARMVLEGNLQILNDPEVLYFKNPSITDGIPASTRHNWKDHTWVTYINNHAFYK